MVKDSCHYKKISSGTTFVTSHRLYLGDDHLLAVEGSITEHYRRFYFKDLQAVVIRKTIKGTMTNIILVIFLLCAFDLFVSGVAVFYKFGITLGSIILICLVFNLIKGPTCECRFKTSVQFERIDSICYLPKAHKVVKLIMPMIQQAQGSFTQEDMYLRFAQASGPGSVIKESQ